jgi:hypothetical protein
MTVTHSDEALRREADSLLDAGLRDTLANYGEVHVIGSYALRLMTWRDLDIHLVRDCPDLVGFFEVGAAVAALLEPHRMHFRDERRVGTPGLPRGLYWGVYLGDERAGAWKIDVWSTDRAGFEDVRCHGERLAARLSEASRHTILTIKSACWQHPEYRRGFSSGDIYSAVLDHGVADVEGFWRFIGAANSDRATR